MIVEVAMMVTMYVFLWWWSWCWRRRQVLCRPLASPANTSSGAMNMLPSSELVVLGVGVTTVGSSSAFVIGASKQGSNRERCSIFCLFFLQERRLHRPPGLPPLRSTAPVGKKARRRSTRTAGRWPRTPQRMPPSTVRRGLYVVVVVGWGVVVVVMVGVAMLMLLMPLFWRGNQRCHCRNRAVCARMATEHVSA